MTSQISHLEHLSYSSINSYLLCPRSWKYHYLDKIKTRTGHALKFGSAAHKTIEDSFAAKNSGLEVEHAYFMNGFMEHFSPCKEDLEMDWGFSSYDQQIEIAERIFGNEEITAELLKLDPDVHPETGVASELFVTLEVPEVPIPIIGYVDLIDVDGVPGDFKTSSKKWGQGKADGEMQPAFYLTALSQMNQTDILDGKFLYYILTKTKSPIFQRIETYRTPSDLFFIYDLVKSVWDAIEAGAFPHNPSGWKCSPIYCGYWDICRGKYE